jgi:hypothetical protein
MDGVSFAEELGEERPEELREQRPEFREERPEELGGERLERARGERVFHFNHINRIPVTTESDEDSDVIYIP